MNKIPYEVRVQTYINALIANGEKLQLVVAVEELSECIKEICKALRGKANEDHLAEEVADATIVLEQVVMFFGIQEQAERIMDEKIRRLDRDLRGIVHDESGS